jgi:hypothetical protein
MATFSSCAPAVTVEISATLPGKDINGEFVVFKKLMFSVLFAFFGPLAAAAELQIEFGQQKWVFDQDQLLSIAPATLTVQSPWDDMPSTFTGVYLQDLLTHLTAEADTLTATALNDYQVTIEIPEAVNAGAFIAILRDGKPMPIRNKGPFWIIFDWNEASSETKVSLLSSWSIWQLKSLQLQPQQ